MRKSNVQNVFSRQFDLTGVLTFMAENTTKEGKRQGEKQGSGDRGELSGVSFSRPAGVGNNNIKNQNAKCKNDEIASA